METLAAASAKDETAVENLALAFAKLDLRLCCWFRTTSGTGQLLLAAAGGHSLPGDGIEALLPESHIWGGEGGMALAPCTPYRASWRSG